MTMGETIRITMDDGFEMPCYHAVPAGERRGGLVLVQEIFGVTDHIRELCDEYAQDGYEVVSPGLFERIEPGCALGYSGRTGNGRSRSRASSTTGSAGWTIPAA